MIKINENEEKKTDFLMKIVNMYFWHSYFLLFFLLHIQLLIKLLQNFMKTYFF